MLRTLRRAGLVAAVATVAVATAGTPASATLDPAALALAQAQTDVDLSLAVADAATTNASNPDVTCANPVPVGAPATVPFDYVVGETYGFDAVDATGYCVSLQGRDYWGTLSVFVQYQAAPNSAFSNIPGCTSSSSGPANGGVLNLVAPPVTCKYELGQAWTGKPHRAYAILTNSQVPTATYEAPSPYVWQGGI